MGLNNYNIKNTNTVTNDCLYRSKVDKTETRCRYYHIKTTKDRYFPECNMENCPILHPNLIEEIVKTNE